MATQQGPILITGATGKQGGAVARHMLAKGFKLRALTRKPEGAEAKALAQKGVEIVPGDLDDAASLERALTGVWGTFAVQNTWEAGVEKEEEQGKRFAHLARKAGVRHYVYTSVASAHRNTGIPHFENKWRIEQTVRSLDFSSHVILRPVFFMENLPSPWFLHGDKMVSSLKPDTKLQMIASDDIGRYGALAFERHSELNRVELDIAGDAVTMPEAARALSELTGRNVDFVQIPVSEIRKSSEDFALMLEWFDRTGYDVDIAGNEKKYGIHCQTLGEWVKGQKTK